MSDPNRHIQVAAISQDAISRTIPEDLVTETFRRMDQAAAYQPDIVCLPEGFCGGDGEGVPGPMTERVSAWARAHNCYVLCSMKVLEGNFGYNSSVVIDRRGEIQGRYDKIHPTEGEVIKIRPGALEPPVFKTDFGVIGIQICFDVNWRETWAQLKKKGAEIVFYASAYPAHRQLTSMASIHQYYVVSSTKSRPSRVYDITGRVLDQSGMFRQWTMASLCLTKRLFEIDGHVGKVNNIEKKYGRKVEVVWYHDEDWFTLESLDPELPVKDIMEEFGLIPLTEYIARNTVAQDIARG
jgi:beta-ureidopropionase